MNKPDLHWRGKTFQHIPFWNGLEEYYLKGDRKMTISCSSNIPEKEEDRKWCARVGIGRAWGLETPELALEMAWVDHLYKLDAHLEKERKMAEETAFLKEQE